MSGPTKTEIWARYSAKSDVFTLLLSFSRDLPKMGCNHFKLLFLRQFLTDWPEIKTGCFPICIICACYIKWYLMSLFQFSVFGFLKGSLKVQLVYFLM
jgi:hypothetical protein